MYVTIIPASRAAKRFLRHVRSTRTSKRDHKAWKTITPIHRDSSINLDHPAIVFYQLGPSLVSVRSPVQKLLVRIYTSTNDVQRYLIVTWYGTFLPLSFFPWLIHPSSFLWDSTRSCHDHRTRRYQATSIERRVNRAKQGPWVLRMLCLHYWGKKWGALYRVFLYFKANGC